MVQAQATVIDVERNGPFARVILDVPEIAQTLSPGRFVLADLGSYLRTPLFPARLGSEEFDVLVSPDHLAAALEPGEGVNLIGPLGRGFDVPAATRRLLLVADMSCLPVLLPLARQERECSVALLLSAPTAAELYPVRLLPPTLEVHVVTGDGSAGSGDSVTDLFPDLVRWAHCVCVAFDPVIYPALTEIVREVRLGPGEHFAQALIVPPIPCGVGACQGCVVQSARGVKLACVDGPVFDLLEL